MEGGLKGYPLILRSRPSCRSAPGLSWSYSCLSDSSRAHPSTPPANPTTAALLGHHFLGPFTASRCSYY
jgi:hypothetical protein